MFRIFAFVPRETGNDFNHCFNLDRFHVGQSVRPPAWKDPFAQISLIRRLGGEDFSCLVFSCVASQRSCPVDDVREFMLPVVFHKRFHADGLQLLSRSLFVNLQSQRICRSLRFGFRLVFLHRADHCLAIASWFRRAGLRTSERSKPIRPLLALDSLQTALLMSCTPHDLLLSVGEHGWPVPAYAGNVPCRYV